VVKRKAVGDAAASIVTGHGETVESELFHDDAHVVGP
jgi:hypothetical protein